MIPIKDYIRTKSFPVVNTGFLIVTAAVFVYQITRSPDEARGFTVEYAFVAGRFFDDPLGQLHTVFTTIFLHGGILHFGGNMLFLFIFGDNVEDALGHVRYFLFYLVTGALAALAQGLVMPDPSIPLVGASGAISAVLGGYMVLYPGSRVLTLIPIGFFFMSARIPAFILLGVWALLQFLSGWMMVTGGPASNVGYVAHVAGFVAGLLYCLGGRKRYLEKFRRDRRMLYDGRRNSGVRRGR